MNDAVDMAAYVAPKSDQLNADDLIAGPRTITITRVRVNGSNADQPVAIHFEGDNNKPYLACKSMRRVMVSIWGTNAAAYVGRSMTLYRDESVQFGGMKVGGIRISHMSHIDAPQTIALTATRARRAPFTVEPLMIDPGPPTAADYEACSDAETLAQLEKRRAAHWKKVPTDQKPQLKAASEAAAERIKQQPPPTDGDRDFLAGYDSAAPQQSGE